MIGGGSEPLVSHHRCASGMQCSPSFIGVKSVNTSNENFPRSRHFVQ